METSEMYKKEILRILVGFRLQIICLFWQKGLISLISQKNHFFFIRRNKAKANSAECIQKGAFG